MTSGEISGHFDQAKSQLKSEHDSMVQKVKEEVSASKKKALAKV
ncbi:MAG TPA: hypothetical protein VLA68_01500 [Nitrososphaera sp.]|nr:hypothetical protein [Nitrososphaera sp.]